MTIKEVKRCIKDLKIKGDPCEFDRGYNMALKHAIRFIEMYEQHPPLDPDYGISAAEYPLGRNDYQE